MLSLARRSSIPFSILGCARNSTPTSRRQAGSYDHGRREDAVPEIVPLPFDYVAWLADLKARIHNAQQRAALAVNRELVLLYWQIGRDILTRQEREGWGAKVSERLAQDLRSAFPDMKGFSRANLMYMRAFAEAWPNAVIVQQAVGQLPWGHNLVLLAKLKTPEQRLERLQLLDDAVNALISPDSLRREFFGHERLVATLYRAVKPDPAALEFASRVACLGTISETIRAKLSPNPPDIAQVMGRVNALLDESITGMTIREQGPPALDLSKINFAALAQRFRESRHKNTDLEVLKAAIRIQLEKLIRLNRTRTDFAEKFEDLIDSYNAGSRSIEELFEALVKLSRSLSEEEQRHIRENMTEEELVIFDILTRPAPALSTEERAEVKQVAHELLTRLKQLLVLNRRQKSTARSQLNLAIEDALDSGLPRVYTPELYRQKCFAVFEHVYESYPERDAGVFAAAV